MTHNGKSRDDLARQANLVRSKLLHTVEQLDQRRHEVLDLRTQLQRHVRQIFIAGGVVLLATSAGVAWVVSRVATASRRRRRDRWILAKDMWRHPDRAMRGERRSVFEQVARSVLTSLVTAALMLPARRVLAELGGARSTPPR